MKIPWWIHLTAGCVLFLSGIAAWHSWMIYTRDDPVVILHKHLYVPECAWLDEKDHQTLWNEIFDHEGRIRQLGAGGLLVIHAIKEARDDATQALSNEDARIQVDLAQIRVDLKASALEIKKLKKAICAQNGRCGW